MQLTRAPGKLRKSLGLLTANLLAATGAHAATVPDGVASIANAVFGAGTDVAGDLGRTRVDSAVLVYQEAGGRVRAIEPVVGATLNRANGDAISVKLTVDTLTGATPNGALPWLTVQSFSTPAAAPTSGSTATVTSASGKSMLVTIPGVGAVRQYTVPAKTLPVDAGFMDERRAIDLGFTKQWSEDLRLSVGLSASRERDFRSTSLSGGFSRDFNEKNTTVSAGLNLEFDESRPSFGTPVPLSYMVGRGREADDGPEGGREGSGRVVPATVVARNLSPAKKTVSSLVVGSTQVVNRRWLTQVSYNLGSSQGYQTDPYRIISQVNRTSGAPSNYLYESRPRSRIRQSVYWDNKLAIGPTFADLSVRGYHDSWGINSITIGAAERVPLTSWVYVEPQARYYQQTAANFFRDFLINGQAMPTFVSSDGRLAKFSATTVGLKVGLNLFKTGELYVSAEQYDQTGEHHPASAVGSLKTLDLFSGVSATSVIVGYSFAF